MSESRATLAPAADLGFRRRSVAFSTSLALRLLAFYVAYVLAGGFGQGLAIVPGLSITFWPPAGLFVATLVLTPRHQWPWWIATGCLAELTCNAVWFHSPIPLALIYFAANALEALTAAWLIGRFASRPFRLATLEQVGVFVIMGAALAPIVGASIIATTDALIGKHDFVTAWTHVWLGDGTGLLVSMPLALVTVQAWNERAEIPTARLLEAAATMGVLVVLAALAFGQHLPTVYLLLLPILWAAARFQLRGAAAALAAVALTGAVIVHEGAGAPGVDPEIVRQQVVMLQTLLGVCAAAAILVAALSLQHRQAIDLLRDSNEALEQRVAARTAELRRSEQRLTMALDAAHAATWHLHADTRQVSLSDRALALFGSPPAGAPTVDQALALVHPDDRKRVHRSVLHTLATGAPYREELRIIDRDGGVRWLLSHAEMRTVDNRAELVGLVQDITQRKRAEAHTQLLMREINHRAKNLLGLVQAIARQTAATSPADFLPRFLTRLQALAANHDLLSANAWRGVDLESLARAQLAAFTDLIGHRIVLAGPAVQLSAAASQAIGMALHELAANAAKHGALSSATGRIDLSWLIEGDTFAMSWRECGGPAMVPPARQGFGSAVLTTLVDMSLRSRTALRFSEPGLTWTLRCPAVEALKGDGMASVPGSAEVQAPFPSALAAQ